MNRESRAADAAIRTPRGRARLPALRRQLGECVVLPTVAALLPWPLAWRTMRALTAHEHFFGTETMRAQSMCDAQGLVPDAPRWRQQYRLTRAVDHVDPAISALRSDRWMARHLRVEGDPVPKGPCIFVGFHYGTGFWSLRHLRRLGHRVSFVSAPVDPAHWRDEPLRLAFIRWRQANVARAGGAPVIYVGGSGDKIRGALRAGTSVLGLIDVPEATTSTVSVRLLGRDVQFPDGLLRIGVSERVPLIGYVASLDANTGARLLRFTRLPDDPAKAVHALATLLDAAIRANPAAWHFWSEWPRLAARTTDLRDDGATGLG